MPIDEPADVVARFLRANSYVQTLDAFLSEAGLPPDAGSLTSGALTVEQILKEKRLYDLSMNFEKVSLDSEAHRWSVPAPQQLTPLQPSSSANILQILVATLVGVSQPEPQICFLVSSANRRLTKIKLDDLNSVGDLVPAQDSPVLSFLVLDQRYLVFTAMSGRLSIYDLLEDELVSKRSDHTKYAVKVSVIATKSGERLLATAGWDGKVFVYDIGRNLGHAPELGAPRFVIQLASNPEDIVWVEEDDSQRLFLIVARRDSTFLWFYPVDIKGAMNSHISDDPEILPVGGRQNLAPNSNAWVAFTPAALAICPTDSTLIAVGTAAVPHMKLIVARLLLPAPSVDRQETATAVASGTPTTEQHEAPLMPNIIEARAALAQQEREAAAIVMHCSTLATQTNYSTPALAWRPDGSGIWVNSDDGLVRGVESQTGKIISSLSGHEPGSKIRCLWAGQVTAKSPDQASKEILLSGGFDQRLCLWQS